MLNPFSWSLDGWFLFLQIAAFVVLGVTVAVGYFLSTRQAAEILELKQGLANAETRRAEVELELRKQMLRQTTPRWAHLASLDEFLKGKPTASFEILFVPDHDEAHRTAMSVEGALSVSGWEILRNARPISPAESELILPQFATPAWQDSPFNMPLISRMGALSEFTVIVSLADLDSTGFPKPDSAANALLFGLN